MTATLSRPRITIIGSGAMGSLFAASLSSLVDVAMLSHWPEQIEAVKKHGLTCRYGDGRSSMHHFTISDDPRTLAPVHLALVLVKAYQTARAAIELAPILEPDGIAVTLQNGLGNFEALEKALGHGRVVQGVTAVGATMVSPGVVRDAGRGPTHIARIAGKGQRLEDLAALFNRAGLPTTVTDDVQSLQWGKLAINAGINPLTAILRVRNGFLAEDESAKRVMCAAAEECSAVTRKLGISLPYPDASVRVIEVAEATAENYSSMLQDVLRGAPTEINAINGAVSSNGRLVGLPTPVNDELWRLVSELHSHPQGQTVADIDNILDQLLRKVGQGQS